MEVQFIETIKLQGNRLHNLSYHHARANQARHELLGLSDTLDLAQAVSMPAKSGRGVYKCRITFSDTVHAVDITPYRRKQIKSLRLIDGGDIDYRYKYADRSAINLLFDQRGTCDDILIIKDGFITDTSYANVAFFDGSNWYTPSTPLLKGTKRQQLLDEGVIREAVIRQSDLSLFRECVVFNAMMDFEKARSIPVDQVLL